ncbi:biogenesis of lysosome-related organelles complex 1 subunit 5 isoform X2 [Syngnathoides biaculeatus]|uniref:biogenesis of lysosome-related organelles complex 1 subunit 5 isoform X2 n=1 Tax=Syngnathoides biaculeatus TaxID=300417 RepID=UPI002ADE0CBE|nr:biogenesis of lysosome-related organelles complex 1 subunit 5 isoform X2 [Syngnathoides biaculeatus]
MDRIIKAIGWQPVHGVPCLLPNDSWDWLQHSRDRHEDVGDIQSRLLDHRPVINAEIRYFVREFEEKRAHRESRLLESLSKVVQEANEQVPSDLEFMKQQLSNVIARLKAANHIAERIQEKKLEAQQGSQLQENKDRMKNEWAEFVKEQQRLKEEVGEEHAKAVGHISIRYSEKKKDLDKLSDV